MAELMRYAQLVEGGKTIKQGEIFELAFQLFGSDNVITVPTVGQVIGIKIANMSGVVLETTGVVDGNKIKFTVSENIGSGKMRLEIKITEGTTLIQKYPAEGWIVLNITASLDDVGAGNVYAVTAQQMRDEIATFGASVGTALTDASEAKTLSLDTQTQLDTIIIASGTSDAETIQARGGEPLLYNRLDGIDVSLADKPTYAEVDTKVAQIVSGTPKGTYATLALLQAAFPTGSTGVYIVTTGATAGHWYYWNGSAWTDGGQYQSTGFVDSGGYFNATNVEGALQEVGETAFFAVTNDVVNGSYETTLNPSWLVAGVATIDETKSLVGTKSLNIASATQTQYAYQDVAGTTGDKFYVRGAVYKTSGTEAAIAIYPVGVSSGVMGYVVLGTAFNTAPINEWLIGSGIFTTTNAGIRIQVGRNGAFTYNANFDAILSVNLTKMYGVGKEPTLAEFEELLFDSYPLGWFEGTTNLFNAKRIVADTIDIKKQLEVKDDLSYFEVAYIKDRKLTCNPTVDLTTTAKYTGVDLGVGNLPKSMKCKCTFSPIGTETTSVVLISNPLGLYSVANITFQSLHIGWKKTGLSIGLFIDGVNINLLSYTYPALVYDGVTEYEFGWSVSGNTITCNNPDGTTSTITDTRIPQVMGRYCTIEHFWNIANASKAEYTYFEVLSDTTNPVKDKFLRPNGAIGVAPTGQNYAQFTNDYTN